MKRISVVFLFLAVCAIALPASALTATGTLAVSGTLAESVQIFITSGTLTLGGTAQDATVSAGTIQKFGGSLTGGFSQTGSTASNFTIAGNFNAEVDYANGASPTYHLTAALNSAAPAGTVWTLGTIATLSTTAQDLQTAGTYGAPSNYTLSIQIANTSTGSIARTISLVATTN